ncbi:hypothetical protein ACLOJK_040461, partial [Asimina triloba]
ACDILQWEEAKKKMKKRRRRQQQQQQQQRVGLEKLEAQRLDKEITRKIERIQWLIGG